jgi:hypothetical protein
MAELELAGAGKQLPDGTPACMPWILLCFKKCIPDFHFPVLRLC